MYAHAATPTRSMTRPGIRSKNGCFTCRQRKKKCNEEKPICSGCKRNCLECSWPSADPSVKKGGVQKPTSTVKRKNDIIWRELQPVPTDLDLVSLSTSAANVASNPSGESRLSDLPRRTSHTAADRQRLDNINSPPSTSGSNSSAERTRSLPELSTFESQNASARSDNRDAGLCTPGAGNNTTADQGSPAVAGFSTHSMSPPAPEMCKLTRGIAPSDVADAARRESCGSLPVNAVAGAEFSEDAIIDDSEDLPEMMVDDFDALDEVHVDQGAAELQPNLPFSMSVSVPGRMSVFPQQDPDAFHLLSFYLSRTANSMGNGSTDSNPFVSTLIPLAFSNPLVLQLILAQSAVHRQVGQIQSSDQIARRYYTGSLRMFRSAIGDYVSGQTSTDKLVLTTGSLILSLTEVARGDVDGNTFDHIIAAKSLLVDLSGDKAIFIPQDLMDFLIEYYTHMSALSIISVDSEQRTANPLVDADIEKLARKLIDKKYVGQLCGCWLELLLVIPHIFDLGQRMRGPEPPSPDDITMFACLQAQVVAFEPDASVSEETRLASLVFKQAVLLYLWSILGCYREDQADGLHSNLMRTAVTDAISTLGQFSASCRVNTSLCWPLTIIGCCAAEESLQAILRTRLQTMFTCIGLGNMGETLQLLERVWKLPIDQRSPWTLCKLMQEHQRWISFA